MSNEVAHLRSSVPGKEPRPDQMFPGRLAMNTADGKLFTLNTEGEVVVVASEEAVSRAEASIQTINGEEPDEAGNVELPQKMDLSVSLASLPEPGALLFYQVIAKSMKFEGGIAAIDPNTAPASLPVLINETGIGNIVISSSGTQFPELPVLSPLDVLSVQAPPDWGDASKLSLVLTFRILQ